MKSNVDVPDARCLASGDLGAGRRSGFAQCWIVKEGSERQRHRYKNDEDERQAIRFGHLETSAITGKLRWRVNSGANDRNTRSDHKLLGVFGQIAATAVRDNHEILDSNATETEVIQSRLNGNDVP